MNKNKYKSIELFVGAGGLGLGLAQAGFKHQCVVEHDKSACDTVRLNQANKHPLVSDWSIQENDVTKIDFSSFSPGIDLLAGGPPCQPFSLGGKQLGQSDRRNMFPEMIRAVRELRPKFVLIENVKGLLIKHFTHFFEYILLQLEFPEITCKPNENATEHLSRLEKAKTRNRKSGLRYNVVFRLLNAADFGVPQRRERVFIVAVRQDLGLEWSFPTVTHGLDALLHNQWVSGVYWDKHEIAIKKRPEPPPRYMHRIKKLPRQLEPSMRPWRTIRDAIYDLPKPSSSEEEYIGGDHVINPGARVYKGHTGSPIDEPSKTLKAGINGVPGGENMILFPSGDVRYFTIRESARIQSFPDDYLFGGSWSSSMKQLGNAVPVHLANVLGCDIYKCLN